MYYMLMASLPPIEPLFSESRTPISRRQLEKRLEMLSPGDGRELRAVVDLMHWHRLPMDTLDQQIVERAEHVFDGLRCSLLREEARFRIELRSIVAALRRRAAGEPPPARGEKWGYTGLTGWIGRMWSRPDFGLSATHPWVTAVNQAIIEGDALAAERLQLQTSFWHHERAAAGHYFDFESAALYVLRWDIVHRWTSYDESEADARYEELVTEGLGDYSSLHGSL
jgi:hypothetical protein